MSEAKYEVMKGLRQHASADISWGGAGEGSVCWQVCTHGIKQKSSNNEHGRGSGVVVGGGMGINDGDDYSGQLGEGRSSTTACMASKKGSDQGGGVSVGFTVQSIKQWVRQGTG